MKTSLLKSGFELLQTLSRLFHLVNLSNAGKFHWSWIYWAAPPLPLRRPRNGLLLKAVLVTVLNWAFGKQFWIFICAVDNLIFFSEDILTDLFRDKEPVRNHFCNWQGNSGQEWSKRYVQKRVVQGYFRDTWLAVFIFRASWIRNLFIPRVP